MSFLLFDLDGLTLSAEERQLIQNPKTAGIILFKRNYQNFAQLAELISDIRLSANRRFMIAVDQEGGRVQRFEGEFTPLPAVGDLLSMANDHEHWLQLCYEFGWLMASEIRAAGLDISFAPVADVDIGISKVIGKRSFASESELVKFAVEAYINGMAEAGMAATIKHFPGHGGVADDSHVSAPVDYRDLEQLDGGELGVFKYLIQQGVEAVMPAHVIYEKIAHSPASFSQFWLKEVLRDQLAYEGCIFSDDLSMHAASVMGPPAERASMALAAGCDIVLCCNDRQAVLEIVDRVEWQGNSRWHKLCAESPVMADRDQMNKIQSSTRYAALTEYFKRT